MLCSKESSKLGTIETDEEDLTNISLTGQRTHTDDTKKRVRCTRNTMDPMVNTTHSPILRLRRCIIPRDFADAVTAKTNGSVKVMMNPAGGNIVA